jgi:hypothetical protein
MSNNKLILEFSISTNKIFFKIQAFPSQMFFFLKNVFFENFNISEKKKKNVKTTKVIGCFRLDLG